VAATVIDPAAPRTPQPGALNERNPVAQSPSRPVAQLQLPAGRAGDSGGTAGGLVSSYAAARLGRRKGGIPGAAGRTACMARAASRRAGTTRSLKAFLAA